MKRLLFILIVALAFVSTSNCYATIASGTSGTCTWTISDDGTLTVQPKSGTEGTLEKWLEEKTVPWRNHRASIKKVVFKGKVNALTCLCMFDECNALESVDLNGLNTSKVENMIAMFNLCSSLKKLDVSMLKTTNVTTMASMFNSTTIEALDLSNFDTRNVTNMSLMFGLCESLTSLDVSKFNTSNVVSMGSMFYDCKSLTKLNLTNFVTTNANINNLFAYDTKLTTIISSASTPSKLKDDTFSSLPTLGTCKLTCPTASTAAYKKADGWKHLFPTTAGIEDIDASDNAQPTVTFSTSGVRQTAPRKGINIINGKKVMVK